MYIAMNIEIETLILFIFFFLLGYEVNIFFFTAFFEMFISLSLQPSLTTREKSFFFFKNSCVPYYTQLHVLFA